MVASEVALWPRHWKSLSNLYAIAVSQAHQDRNEARMLTPVERKEKKMMKLVGEAAPATLVALYKARLPAALCHCSYGSQGLQCL